MEWLYGRKKPTRLKRFKDEMDCIGEVGQWKRILKEWQVRHYLDAWGEIEICERLGFKEVFDDSGTFPDGEWLENFLDCTQHNSEVAIRGNGNAIGNYKNSIITKIERTPDGRGNYFIANRKEIIK